MSKKYHQKQAHTISVLVCSSVCVLCACVCSRAAQQNNVSHLCPLSQLPGCAAAGEITSLGKQHTVIADRSNEGHTRLSPPDVSPSSAYSTTQHIHTKYISQAETMPLAVLAGTDANKQSEQSKRSRHPLLPRLTEHRLCACKNWLVSWCVVGG